MRTSTGQIQLPRDTQPNLLHIILYFRLLREYRDASQDPFGPPTLTHRTVPSIRGGDDRRGLEAERNQLLGKLSSVEDEWLLPI